MTRSDGWGEGLVVETYISVSQAVHALLIGGLYHLECRPREKHHLARFRSCLRRHCRSMDGMESYRNFRKQRRVQLMEDYVHQLNRMR